MNQSPVFRCHLCGGGEDPITFLARTAQISLDEAAETLQAEKGFFGEDISPLLRKVKFVQDLLTIHDEKADDFRADLDETRALTFIQDGNDSYMKDRSRIKLRDLHERFPAFRNAIPLGRDKERNVLMQVYRNHAAAPGKIQILSEEGLVHKEIILDEQSLGTHFYVSAPKGMLDRPWDENVLLFPNEATAEQLWDWILEWGNEERDSAILAVHSIKGEFRKVDVRNVTMLPIGDENAWAGTIFSAGDFSDVRVFRLDAEPRGLSAREVFYPLRNVDQWSRLPTVAEDFVSGVTKAYEERKPQTVRRLLDEAMTGSHLSKAAKAAVLERVKMSMPVLAQQEVDRIVEDISVSTPFVVENHSYVVGIDHYVRESRGRETLVSNFRSKILARIRQTRFPHKTGSCVYLVRTRVMGCEAPVISLIEEKQFYLSPSLMSRLRDDCVRQGAPVPMVNVTTDERRLPKIIEGTQTDVPEMIDFPCLGFDRTTFSFNFPGLKLSRGNEYASQIVTSGLSEIIASGVMPQANEGDADAIISLMNGPAEVRAAIMKAIGFSVWFLFRASRASSSFHAFLTDERFASLVSRVSGLKTIDDQWIGNRTNPIIVQEVPCLVKNVHPTWASRLFKRCVYVGEGLASDDRFVCRTVVPEVDDTFLAMCPTGSLKELMKAVLFGSNLNEVVDRLFSGKISPEVREEIRTSVLGVAEDYFGELERLLAFLDTPEGRPFVEFVGDRALISTHVVDEFFGGTVVPKKILEQLRLRVHGDLEFLCRRPKRVREWSIPASVLTGEDKIVQFHA